jgi:hypothetical protein
MEIYTLEKVVAMSYRLTTTDKQTKKQLMYPWI